MINALVLSVERSVFLVIKDQIKTLKYFKKTESLISSQKTCHNILPRAEQCRKSLSFNKVN